MTDKEKIKEEIEKLKNKQLSIFSKGESVEICGTALTCIGVYNQLLSFINSLPEEHNEDLEKEFNRFLDEEEGVPRMWHSDEQMEWGMDIARHFAEWQKQQMVKDAVESVMDIRKWPAKAQVEFYDRLPAFNVRTGDKVKIIILKTE